MPGIVSLFCDEGSELLPETEIPFSGIVPIDLACPAGGNMSVPEEQQIDKDNKIPCHGSITEFMPETENLESSLKLEKNPRFTLVKRKTRVHCKKTM
ncbi:hypothetical protein Patl1_37524 [Pistacia atlantica]|nr:hypothetical protein Patl1_37524 [Pistacia atlantica]